MSLYHIKYDIFHTPIKFHRQTHEKSLKSLWFGDCRWLRNVRQTRLALTDDSVDVVKCVIQLVKCTTPMLQISHQLCHSYINQMIFIKDTLDMIIRLQDRVWSSVEMCEVSFLMVLASDSWREVWRPSPKVRPGAICGESKGRKPPTDQVLVLHRVVMCLVCIKPILCGWAAVQFWPEKFLF